MEPLLGQIVLFPYTSRFVPPGGWARCEGQLLPISQNQALFALIGVTFGGDGRTNFALPNLKGKEPAPGLSYCIALQGVFPEIE